MPSQCFPPLDFTYSRATRVSFQVRRAAWDFGKKTLPQRGEFQTLFDALQLQLCNETRPLDTDVWAPPVYPTPDSNNTHTTFFVDAAAATGSPGTGTVARPFRSVAEAVAAAAGVSNATIVVRAGVYYEKQIQLTTAHSGLTIQNFEGEHATISGGVVLSDGGGGWVPVDAASGNSGPPIVTFPLKSSSSVWTLYNGVNGVFGRAEAPNSSTSDVKFLGVFSSLESCENAASTNGNGPFHSFTWFTPEYAQAQYARHCYGTVSDFWYQPPHMQPQVVTGLKCSNIRALAMPCPPRPPAPGPLPPPAPPPGQIWALDLAHMGDAVDVFLGLRLDGRREIRAKYPNGDPEISGAEGWIVDDTNWLKPLDKFPDGSDKYEATKDIISNASMWPGVHWPMIDSDIPSDAAECLYNNQDGGSACGSFHIGHGGFCSDLDPPAGYWCSKYPPRGQAYNHTTRDTCGGKYKSCGGTQIHMAPAGIVYSTGNVLPNAPKYSNATGAMVQAWRGKAGWYTNGCLVKTHDVTSGILHFDQDIGCNQGGEGMVSGGKWWIENVLEELDCPREWFFNRTTRILYYMPNVTSSSTGKTAPDPPPNADNFAATRTKVIFNITGSQKVPVVGITIRGLEIRDTALTYYGTDEASKHSMPTGGDWALERAGAILFEGTEWSTVSECLFQRLDGNGIFLSEYNRNATLSHNEFAWIGGTAMAAWGSTGYCLDSECKNRLPWGIGPDARGGNQPRYTRVIGNLVREIGLIQKQSSMWFQAASALNVIANNVHFNGPRAGVNFNDWMGGGDVLEGNLLANCVRESGDHGPWNSWDRVPYITNVGMVIDRTRPMADHRPDLPGHTRANSSYPSITPLFRQVRHNFILGTYNTLFDIDTDDGSGYIQVYNNFFIYGGGGLKAFFGGRWQHHWNNVYGYVGNNGCFWTGVNVAFFNNYCVGMVSYPARLSANFNQTTGCPVGAIGETMTIYNNTILTPKGTQVPTCKGVAGLFPQDTELLSRGASATAPFPKAATV